MQARIRNVVQHSSYSSRKGSICVYIRFCVVQLLIFAALQKLCQLGSQETPVRGRGKKLEKVHLHDQS